MIKNKINLIESKIYYVSRCMLIIDRHRQTWTDTEIKLSEMDQAQTDTCHSHSHVEFIALGLSKWQGRTAGIRGRY